MPQRASQAPRHWQVFNRKVLLPKDVESSMRDSSQATNNHKNLNGRGPLPSSLERSRMGRPPSIKAQGSSVVVSKLQRIRINTATLRHPPNLWQARNNSNSNLLVFHPMHWSKTWTVCD